MTIANKLENSNYTFGFILENNLPLGGYIQITFPSQYPDDLGFNITNPLSCTVRCTQDGKVIKVYFPQELKAEMRINGTLTTSSLQHDSYKCIKP